MKSSFSAAGCKEVYKLLHYSLLHKCAVYTFSLHSIHSRGVGHMEKEPESKTPSLGGMFHIPCKVGKLQ